MRATPARAMRHAGRPCDRLGAEPDRAGVGAIEAAQHVEHGGLAGAVRPDQARHLARLRLERDVVRRAHAAEGDREPVDRERGARSDADLRAPGSERRGTLRRFGRTSAATVADDALGREPQHDEQQRAEEEQPVLGEPGEHLGQQHHDRRADQRPGDRARAADDHHQHEEDRLREGEGRGRDEARERGEQRAGDAGAQRRDRRTRRSSRATGSRPIDSAATSQSFTARIAAPQRLRASSQIRQRRPARRPRSPSARRRARRTRRRTAPAAGCP